MSAPTNLTTLDVIPDLSALFRRQALKSLPLPGLKPRRAATDPDHGVRVAGVRVDPDHLARYCQATGFRLGNELPVTYPYALAFPLAVAVMDAPGFPFPAMGVVHLSNIIEQRRALRLDETFDVTVHAENLRPHRKGLAIDMITELAVDGEVVWRQTSVFLGPGARFDSSTPPEVAARGHAERALAAPERTPDATPSATLRFAPADTLAYAAASGDKNPIHTSRLGAKLFGFPATIAHGMYTHARMLAALEGVMPRGVRVSADFYKPVILPASTALLVDAPGTQASAQPSGSARGRAWDLSLRKARDLDVLHVAARVEDLARAEEPARVGETE